MLRASLMTLAGGFPRSRSMTRVLLQGQLLLTYKRWSLHCRQCQWQPERTIERRQHELPTHASYKLTFSKVHSAKINSACRWMIVIPFMLPLLVLPAASFLAFSYIPKSFFRRSCEMTILSLQHWIAPSRSSGSKVARLRVEGNLWVLKRT